MYNSLSCHNKYDIKIIKDNKTVEQFTIYNRANSNIYINTSSSGNSATLALWYRNTTENPNTDFSNVSTNVTFTRVTENPKFGEEIIFTGIGYFSGFNSDVSEATEWKITLGNGVRDENGVFHYWSESDFSISTIDSTTTVVVNAQIYFEVKSPNGSIYVDDYNPLLGVGINGTYKYFPQIYPSSFEISPLLTYPNPIIKQILGIGVNSTIYTPQNQILDTKSQVQSSLDYLTINTNGKVVDGNNTNFNRGIIPTLVYKNVMAAPLMMTTPSDKLYPIPVAILNRRKLDEIIEGLNNGEFAYFYASIPDGFQVQSILIDGEIINNSNYKWVAPPQRFEISNVTASIDSSECDSTGDKNKYYSNFLLSNNEYWEPKNGSPVISEYVNLSNTNGLKPTNYRMGRNVHFKIQGRNADTDWENCIVLNPDDNEGNAGSIYKTYYLKDEQYEQYRAYFPKNTIPNLLNENYQVNEAEEKKIPYKWYDKNVVLIGTGNIYDDNDISGEVLKNNLTEINSSGVLTGIDFGHCGVAILKGELEALRNRISEQDTVTSYYISVGVIGTSYFYKTVDTVCRLSYFIKATEDTGA